jgi:hypothetical protein
VQHHQLDRVVFLLQRTRPTWPASELPALDAALRAMELAARHLRPSGNHEDDAFGPRPAPLRLLLDLELAHLQLDAARKLSTEHGPSALLERRAAAAEATAMIRETIAFLRSLEPVRRSA